MKIGIALSGGGIRGIAHAGVLKALEENNIKIDIIGGTSAGSMVASLYAMGYSPNTIFKLFKKFSKKIIDDSRMPCISKIIMSPFKEKENLQGLITGRELQEIYDNLAKRKNIKKISDIKMPIVIPSVDIKESKEYVFTNYVPETNNNNKTTKNQANNVHQIKENNNNYATKYISNVSIGQAVRASSSFPTAFMPFYMENHAFMDGGMLDNVPVYEVKKQGSDKVIAVKFDADPVDENSKVMDIIMKSIDIMGNKISEESLEMSDIALNVYTDKVGLLDVEKLDKCYEYGYKCVYENLERIRKVLEIE